MPLLAGADVGDVDAVVGADDPPGRRRLVLSVDGCLEQVGRADGSGDRGSFLDEGAASLARICSRVHNSILIRNGAPEINTNPDE